MITSNEINRLKKMIGCRVELVEMNDEFAPPEGTKGTVIDVNCLGDLVVNWDNGSHLSVIYGVDKVRRI